MSIELKRGRRKGRKGTRKVAPGFKNKALGRYRVPSTISAYDHEGHVSSRKGGR